MFKDNKYARQYYCIIQNRIENPISGYTENHHIIPKSLGGADDPSNKVRLSAREHWVCHQLLTRMTDGVDRMKMLHPCVLFKKTAGKTSRRYEQLKIQRSLAMRGRKHSEETKQKIRLGNIGRTITDENRQKTSDRLLGKKLSDTHRENIRLGHIGLTHSEEVKRKIGLSNKGKNKGKTASEETRAKLSMASKGKKKPEGHGTKVQEARSIEYMVLCPDGSIAAIKLNKKEWAKDRGLRFGSLVEKSKLGVDYKGYRIIS